MEAEKRIAIVDAGNTRIKLAVFYGDEIETVSRFTLEQHDAFWAAVDGPNITEIFISSVLSEIDNQRFFNRDSVRFFHSSDQLPVVLDYETPLSLGLDRLANAAAIQHLQPEGVKVSIDLGTCVKFDVVDERGHYLGGSISPGLEMRYAALNHFTGKLPLLQPTKLQLVGRNTQDSMHSGVVQGMQGELNHFVNSYLQEYQGLTFFVTGGDAKFFDFPSKSNIFALENLTLKGLFYIYKLNA